MKIYMLLGIMAFMPVSAAANTGSGIHAETERKADYVVTIRGIRLDEFDIGLGQTVAEGGFKPLFVHRSQCRIFFLSQRHKRLIVVKYSKVSIDGEALREEVDRTVAYFKQAGYDRVVLIRYFSQGADILYDSAKISAPDKRNERYDPGS